MLLRLTVLATCVLAVGCFSAPKGAGSSSTGGQAAATSASSSGTSAHSSTASTASTGTTGTGTTGTTGTGTTGTGTGTTGCVDPCQSCQYCCQIISRDPNGCANAYSCDGPLHCQASTSTGTTGGCACPQTDCNGGCVDTRSDPLNCGGCGLSCPSPQCGGQATCTDGTCQPLPPQNCFTAGAATGNGAGSGAGATGGTTGGAVGSTGSTTGGSSCSHSCTNTSDCPSGYTCVDPGFTGTTSGPVTSTCQPCQAPAVVCNGACIYPNDTANCGACGNACGAFQDCVNGECVCKPSNACGQGCACNPDQTRCGDRCVNTASDPAHCGGCSSPACLDGQTCVAGACTPADAGYGAPIFQAASALASSGNGYTGSAAIADLDGDGQADLLQLDSAIAGTEAWVYLRRDGGFGAPVHSVLTSGDYLVLGDFTDAGHLDLVTATSGDDHFWFSPGDGHGGFGPSVTNSVACVPGTMNTAAGDVTGDGLLDLVVTCNPPNEFSDQWVATLPGLGNGTFGAPIFSAVGESIDRIGESIFLVDLNHDGALDLVVGGSVALNVGGGAFGTSTRVTVGSYGEVGAVADLNGDGKPDLVVIDSDSTQASCPINPLNILLGRGDGSFDTGDSYGAPVSPSSLRVGDFDGDGHLDIAVLAYAYDVNFNSSIFVLVYRGDGAGHLQPSAQRYQLPSGADPYSPVGVGDLNGDGRPDLAVWASPSTGSSGLDLLLTR